MSVAKIVLIGITKGRKKQIKSANIFKFSESVTKRPFDGMNDMTDGPTNRWSLIEMTEHIRKG